MNSSYGSQKRLIIILILLFILFFGLTFDYLRTNSLAEDEFPAHISPYVTISEFKDRILQESYTPSRFSFEELIVLNDPRPTTLKYFAQWEKEETSLILSYLTEVDSDDIEYFDLTFIKQDIVTIADQDSILSSVQEIIKDIDAENFSCTTDTTIKCASFWTATDGARLGVTVESPVNLGDEFFAYPQLTQIAEKYPKGVTVISFCLVPYEGRLYYLTNICSPWKLV